MDSWVTDLQIMVPNMGSSPISDMGELEEWVAGFSIRHRTRSKSASVCVSVLNCSMSHSFGGRARDGFDADASGNEPPASGAVDKSSSSPETYLRKKRNVFFKDVGLKKDHLATLPYCRLSFIILCYNLH
jgi:hypothetical protein